MSFVSPTLLCDFYKISHREQYPDKTECVYSTWTPRISRHEGVNEIVVFGHQAFIKKYLIKYFEEYFFDMPIDKVIQDYQRVIRNCLGVVEPAFQHIVDLHDLGYLPLSIKSVPEGSVVPLRTPILTVHNTNPKFFWLTNYIETLASAEMWKASTSATIAHTYRKIFNQYAMDTVGDAIAVQFQGHDFSMRGMSGLEDAILSGMGHLLSFVGTDSIPAILGAEEYYGANVGSELVGTSIPATEHSVMCAAGSTTDAEEMEAFKRLITKVYPDGFISIVSDTRDFWNLIQNVVDPLKDTIMARNGRVVIRPDSGDPVKIMTGDPQAATEMERKGLIECLWDIFGGTITEKGFKLLDSHIGAIYGEAINTQRAEEICANLKTKGFASINAVFGIGSYTYQFNTRDTYGFAYKSTLCVIDGKEHLIFKNPKTDDGSKRSQRGRVSVFKQGGLLSHSDGHSLADHLPDDMLVEIYRDGMLLVDENFNEIRKRVACHQ